MLHPNLPVAPAPELAGFSVNPAANPEFTLSYLDLLVLAFFGLAACAARFSEL
jgi:hypothetical protein